MRMSDDNYKKNTYSTYTLVYIKIIFTKCDDNNKCLL